jgi:hypothetical protein
MNTDKTMSHSFSFLYQGIHKYKRQQLAVLFILIISFKSTQWSSFWRPFVVLLLSTFFVDFIAPLDGVSLATMSSFTQFIMTPLNDVYLRHLSASLLAPLNGVQYNLKWPGDTGGRPLHILFTAILPFDSEVVCLSDSFGRLYTYT